MKMRHRYMPLLEPKSSPSRLYQISETEKTILEYAILFVLKVINCYVHITVHCCIILIQKWVEEDRHSVPWKVYKLM